MTSHSLVSLIPDHQRAATPSSIAEKKIVPRGANLHQQVWIIAAKEFGDRFRSGWVIACVMVWLGAIGLTSFFGLLQIGQIGVQGYDRTALSLLSLVQYLVPL